MKVILYLPENKGSDDVRNFIANLINKEAGIIGLAAENIDSVIVAPPESYPEVFKAHFQTDAYTDTDVYTVIGKANTRFKEKRPEHILFYGTLVFDLILQAQRETDSAKILDWKPKFQIGPEIISHELGHCKDNELRPNRISIEKLELPNGFCLDTVHEYYLSIIDGEFGACYHSSRLYSKEHLKLQCKNDQDSLAQMVEQLESFKADKNYYSVALSASSFFWIYLIQYTKLWLGKHGTEFEDESIPPLIPNEQGLELCHEEIDEVLHSLRQSYPFNIQNEKETLTGIWNGICIALDFHFEKSEQGWGCYWGKLW